MYLDVINFEEPFAQALLGKTHMLVLNESG